MIKLEEAKTIAEQHIKHLNSEQNDVEFALYEGIEQLGKYCAVLNYNSAKYIETENITDAYVGHGPLIIDLRNGRIVETGSAFTAEHYVSRYEEFGNPFAEPDASIDMTTSKSMQTASNINAVKIIRKNTRLNAYDSKKLIDDCAKGEKITIQLIDREKVLNVKADLEEYGFIVRQLAKDNLS